MEEKEFRQKLILINRKKLTIDNVLNIDGLDEDYVEISFDTGKILIEGNALKIEELSGEKKEVTIVGSIDTIAYKSNNKVTSFITRRKK